MSVYYYGLKHEMSKQFRIYRFGQHLVFQERWLNSLKFQNAHPYIVWPRIVSKIENSFQNIKVVSQVVVSKLSKL